MTSATDLAPERRELNSLQTTRLGELAGIASRALDRLTIEEVRVKFGWQIDPRLLLFRRLSGRVLTRDAHAGDYRPWAGALVSVDNTLCDLLHVTDAVLGGGWLVVGNVRRAQIAEVSTSGDGSFSLWIPRFDVESIVRWRNAHPALADLLNDVRTRRRGRGEVLPATSSEEQVSRVERMKDVPDISFRVRSDAAGLLYTERYFDVQWGLGTIPPVELIPSSEDITEPFAMRHGRDGYSITAEAREARGAREARTRKVG